MRPELDMYLTLLEWGLWAVLVPNAIGIAIGSATFNIKIISQIMPAVFVPSLLLAGFIGNTGTSFLIQALWGSSHS